MARDGEWPVGAWEDLAARLDAAGAMTRWAAAEPVLAGWTSVEALRTVLAPGTDRARADAVLGALVRRAAADGGDDPDAVLVLLHLLRRGVFALAGRLAGLAGVDGSPVSAVTAELTCRIRTFPWRRRSRSIAANLLLGAKDTLWKQHCRLSRADTDLVEPGSPLWERLAADAAPVPEPDLADLFDWAAGAGLVTTDDLALLVASERDTHRRVADAYGVHARTVRRHRARTLRVLRQAGDRYLAA